MKTRNILMLVLAICLIFNASACTSGSAASQQAPATSAASTGNNVADSTTAPEPAVTDWAVDNRIDDGSQTTEELYELAKEEGKVVLYSISSRCVKVKESFEAQYPGITCEVYDISQNELLEKVTREYEAGVRNADVIHLKDQEGSIYTEMILGGMVHNYYPDDIVATIENTNYTKYAMPLYIELSQWFYNAETYPDGPPIDSWWDLTRPEWKGKFMMQNPLNDMSLLANLTAFTQYPEVLAEDYEREFGEPITLSDKCPTAAHEFFKRLVENDIIYTSSSDEICEAVGTTGQADPPVGYASSSKIRKNESDGWVLAPINMLPNTGIPAQNNMYIVNECPHPNAAKLLVRWMAGESDGKGGGFSPFNTLGGWPVRNNVALAEGSTPLEELRVAPFDPEFIYQSFPQFNDFWISIIN